MDEEQINEIIEILDSLIEDLPSKPKEKLSQIVLTFKQSPITSEHLMKIQDDLEMLSSMSTVDSFARNEIINIITQIESIYNS